MAETTGIAWTDATFNPWWGCVKVSPGCDFCYAERDAHRYQPGKTLWGVGSERRTFGDKHWNEPLRWARKLPDKLGRRPRVFCASMADVFDKDAPPDARERLWALIEATPELDWLLLTKRIGNVYGMTRWFESPENPLGTLPRNVWLGISVVNQIEADRDIPKLRDVPAAVRWLSCEPLLGPVDLERGGWTFLRSLRSPGGQLYPRAVDWVVVGGESGHRARPMEMWWCDDLLTDCRGNGVPFFFKQGSQANWDDFKNFDAVPESLRVREFPQPSFGDAGG